MASGSQKTSYDAENIDALLTQLPTTKWQQGEFDLYQWEGSWYTQGFLESSIAFQSKFEARDDDIILASPIKSGTTWLKALVYSIVHGRNINDEEDPLLIENPHGIVQSLESTSFLDNKTPDFSTVPSPRIFHSHLPFHSLPSSIRNSACKIVYMGRNPKDAFVSLYHFTNTINPQPYAPYPLEPMLDQFCDGASPFGPHLDHVLEYWRESVKNPEKTVFLKYEQVKREPRKHVKKLAEFLDKPFCTDEEADHVIQKCSIERLKKLEVNVSGSLAQGLKHSSFFRRGVVGDWKNILTEEMSERLDKLTRLKLQGSGLDFDM